MACARRELGGVACGVAERWPAQRGGARTRRTGLVACADRRPALACDRSAVRRLARPERKDIDCRRTDRVRADRGAGARHRPRWLELAVSRQCARRTGPTT